MRSLFFPPQSAPHQQRSTEASIEQLVASGAAGGAYGVDPIDGDIGFRPAGGGTREVPPWTLEKQRTYSIASYRANPMARAIVDTYTSFVVGDSGLSIQCGNDEVDRIVRQFWEDPRNQLANLQELMLRDHILNGETALEMLVGQLSGITRFSPISTRRVSNVLLHGGNPLWPSALVITSPGLDNITKTVAGVNDLTGLREGEITWWASWKTTLDDRRGQPFLGPILDWLDDYDNVVSNLVDRTSLARYLVWDVELKGADDTGIENWIKQRGGAAAPRSGTVEVHNESVTWTPKIAETGAFEDTEATKTILTSIASGSGLAKHWLADPDNANRATALTMAEPVLRRVAGVQKLWLGYITELCRFAVDQAVAHGRLPATVSSKLPGSGAVTEIPAAQSVVVTGPEIAVAEADVTAATMLKLAQGLDLMVLDGIMSQKAARLLAKKAWEQYAGIPYSPELDDPEGDRGKLALAIQDGLAKRAASGPTGAHVSGAGASTDDAEPTGSAVATGPGRLVAVPPS